MDPLRGLIVILEQGRAEPAFEIVGFGIIPVAARFFAPPVEANGVPGKRVGGKDQAETVGRVGDVSDESVDQDVGSADEGFLV